MPDMRSRSTCSLHPPSGQIRPFEDNDRRRTRTTSNRGSSQDSDGGDQATYATATNTAQHHHNANLMRSSLSSQQQHNYPSQLEGRGRGGGFDEYYGYNNINTPAPPSVYDDHREVYDRQVRIESQVRRESLLQEQADAMLAARLAQEEEDRLEAERAARSLEESSQLMDTRDERERLVHQLLQIYTSSSPSPPPEEMQRRPAVVERRLPRVTDKLVRYDAPAGDNNQVNDSSSSSAASCFKSPRCQQQQPHQDFVMISTNATSSDDGSSSSSSSNDDTSSSDVCAVCYEPLDTGVAVSLKMCNHVFHLDCICEALDHQKGCPTCRTEVRSTPHDGKSPSGTMFISRPEIGAAVVQGPGSVNPTVIKIEYKIPHGIQSSYHPNPGMPYKGIGRVAFLPDTSQGNEIIHRLIYAFEHGLTFRVNDKGRVRWGSIPHLPYLGEKAADTIRLTCCTAELDRLGIPDPRSQRLSGP